LGRGVEQIGKIKPFLAGSPTPQNVVPCSHEILFAEQRREVAPGSGKRSKANAPMHRHVTIIQLKSMTDDAVTLRRSLLGRYRDVQSLLVLRSPRQWDVPNRCRGHMGNKVPWRSSRQIGQRSSMHSSCSVVRGSHAPEWSGEIAASQPRCLRSTRERVPHRERTVTKFCREWYARGHPSTLSNPTDLRSNCPHTSVRGVNRSQNHISNARLTPLTADRERAPSSLGG
jgi:hypothetical protein